MLYVPPYLGECLIILGFLILLYVHSSKWRLYAARRSLRRTRQNMETGPGSVLGFSVVNNIHSAEVELEACLGRNGGREYLWKLTAGLLHVVGGVMILTNHL